MKQKRLGQVIVVIVPLGVVFIYFIRGYILDLVPFFPACPIRTTYDIYCPSCGNTRSITALLHGDIITSLRYNIVPMLLLVISLLGYIELITYSFGKHVRILPRKLRYYLILIAILAVYWIVRNGSSYLTP